MKDHQPSRYNITALHRGLRLLTLIGEAQRALAAGEIARLSNLHTSTVHRFLVNLESAGFLTREESSGKYQLGPACVTLGRAALDHLDFHRVSVPYLKELNRLTRETIHLTVRQDLHAVYLEKIESLEPLRIFSQVGAAVPLHCTAVGKVLLAHTAQDELRTLLPRLTLTRCTPNSVSSLQELEAELNRVRRQGYATDLEEYENHIRCIAGPLWDHAGNIKAAFSISGPATRMTRARIRQLTPLVIKISQDVSKQLGYGLPAKSAAPKPRRVPEMEIAVGS
jgi:IclR family KDG regulon transcriptional repressor